MFNQPSGSYLFLVVEDTIFYQSAIQDVLLAAGHSVTCVSSGEEVMETLEKLDPDLILVDILMEGIDGYETVRRIQENPDKADIPIIFLSSDNSPDAEVKGLSMGAVDYIYKPFIPQVFVKRLENAVEHSVRWNNFEQQLNQLAVKSRQLDEEKRRSLGLDILTQVDNRKFFEIHVNQTLVQDNEQGALLMIDIDNFKKINDTYGHLVGDDMLILLSDKLRECVQPNDSIGRFGGDEFMVFLTHCTEEQECIQFAEKLQALFAQAKTEIDKQNVCSLSIGIALSAKSQTAHNFMTLCSQADQAMYEAKKNGKHAYRFYHRIVHDKQRAADTYIHKQVEELKQFLSDKWSNAAVQAPNNVYNLIYCIAEQNESANDSNLQIVLFHFVGSDALDPVELRACMKTLQHAITSSVRTGDFAIPFEDHEYILVLFNATAKDAAQVSLRIFENYFSTCAHPDMPLTYLSDKLTLVGLHDGETTVETV